MKPLSKPLPARGRGFEPCSLYDKKVQSLDVLSIYLGLVEKVFL
jgi:hypothetical protein